MPIRSMASQRPTAVSQRGEVGSAPDVARPASQSNGSTQSVVGSAPALDAGTAARIVARTEEVPPGAVKARHPGLARIDALALTDNAPVYRSPCTGDAAEDAAAIERCLETSNAWSALAAYTTKKDLRDVKDMCQRLNPQRWAEIYTAFYDGVLRAQETKPVELRKRDEQLPSDWFREPFYYTYVQYFGTKQGQASATFDELIEMLDYLEDAGIKNLFLLPHYESPMGDGGYDVSAFVPRADLGGEAAYERFMKVAVQRGFRVATDLPINHTSVKHEWFQAALEGDGAKLDYYLRRDGREKIREYERDGDIVAVYRDPDGTLTERVLIFPDVSREHGEVFEIGGKKVNIYREFYPFQLDLDLQNPALLQEIFGLLGEEANRGIVGKRTDAIAHWIKKPGTSADGLPETHAIHALIKSFLRHVSPKAIILPEAVRGASECATYCGVETAVVGKKASSEGDALFNFDLQGALREMLYLQTSKPFWEKVFRMPELPADATWMNLLEHHDESYLGMITPENRQHLGRHIESRGGVVYKNGMSAGGRYADNLGHDPERIATAIFSLYLCPGVPVMYYGTEIGAGNDHAHAKRAQAKQHAIFEELGLDIPVEKAFDPRELQRGPISAQAFEKAQRGGSAPHATFKRLNHLRAERPSLRSDLLTPIDNGHDGVLSMVKFTDDGSDTPLLALANLTSEAKHLRIPLQQLREKMAIPNDEAFRLFDLLPEAGGPQGRPVDFTHMPGDYVHLVLPPNSRMLVERQVV